MTSIHQMRWVKSYRADPLARVIADRHYNRQRVGSKQFVPPGSCCVLLEREQKAFWVTSAPKAEYVQHDWAGAGYAARSARRTPEVPLSWCGRRSLQVATTLENLPNWGSDGGE